MTRAILCILAVPLLLATTSGRQATFKASVDLVSVDVLVTEGGRPVPGLGPSDFESVVVAQSAKDLNTLFTRIVREMQARYMLNYYPSGGVQCGWHTLEVRVPGKRAEIVARRGYWRR